MKKRTAQTKKPTNDLSHFGLTEREIVCPHCKTGLILSSPMSAIFMARKTCPQCKKDFVIESDVPKAVA